MPKLARRLSILLAAVPAAALVAGAISACVGDDAAATTSGSGVDGAAPQDGQSADSSMTGTDTGTGADASGATDAGACSPMGTFGDPVEVPGLHVAGSSEYFVRFSDDGLSALVTRGPDDGGAPLLYLSDRASADVDFGPGTALPSEVNGGAGASAPGAATFADAKKTLYFEARTASVDIFSSTRASAASTTFTARAAVSGLSGFGDHAQPYFVNDNLYIFFNSGMGDPQGVYVSTRGATAFTQPTLLTNLDGYSFPVLTRDERTIFVGKGSRIYEASRATSGVAFGIPTELPPVVSSGIDTPSDVSVDGCTLFFTRGTGTARKLFKTTRGH